MGHFYDMKNRFWAVGCGLGWAVGKTVWADYEQPERLSSHSKEAGLVIYLAFLAKVANLYYMILTAFKKYWPNTVAKFISGTQETFI